MQDDPNPFHKFSCPSSEASGGQCTDATAADARQRSPLAAPSPATRKRSRAAKQAADASPPKGLVEKLGSQPLRLVVVGHNPSETAWAQGHYYANPGNHMWRILKETGIAPQEIRGAQDDDLMPGLAGVGFTDVGTGTPGTNSADFGASDFKVWAVSFYQRLAQHMADASAAVGCTCGTCGAPAIVAFAGKRHFTELLKLPPPPGTSAAAAAQASGRSRGRGREVVVQLGVQQVLPAGWPLPRSTEVWVMTSTSGASALTWDARLTPWQQLSERLQQVAWPRQVVPDCAAAADSSGNINPGGTGSGAADGKTCVADNTILP